MGRAFSGHWWSGLAAELQLLCCHSCPIGPGLEALGKWKSENDGMIISGWWFQPI